jgi:hypothetical protein
MPSSKCSILSKFVFVIPRQRLEQLDDPARRQGALAAEDERTDLPVEEASAGW